MKRRDFIQKMSFGATAALTTNSVQDVIQLPSTNKKRGVALVGLGNYSTRQLAPALQLTQHCELKAIVTGTPEKAEKWSKQYNIPAKNIYNYQNFDTIKDNPEVDIVFVVLPNSMHAEYAIRAAKAGKHVIVEKPMAMNAAEAKTIIDACKAAKVQLAVSYRLYYEDHHLEMRRLGTEKVYGKVKMLHSGLGYNMIDPTYWRLNKELGGGGAIMDLGVYAIQGVRRTLGELPTQITAQGYNTNPSVFKGIYEAMSFQMTFPSGAVSNSDTTYSSFMDRLYATTEAEWFELRPSFTAMGCKGLASKGKIEFLPPPQYQQIKQMDAFALNVLNNTPILASGEEGWIDMVIIDAIKQAADTGRKVDLTW
jgi:predicted dehydrogenase